ncbi:MAG TPA: DoxX family protein [Longimicrobium sp.]|jgi:hypothetical protein|uniref:DoxX family protein n=1 Tax=Longimicrobium sp. TaxID=2029185 RepID=UPI002ED78AC6
MQNTATYVNAATRADRATVAPARWMLVTGRVLTGLVAVFLLMDGALRVIGFAPYVEGTVQAGYAESLAPGIGLALLVPTLLYLVPRTSILGAILLTGYLGGATATNLRVGMPIAFPLAFGILVWAALYLRDGRLRGMIPVRR